jgi:hypothetical protein
VIKVAESVPVGWVERSRPLEPRAALGLGAAAGELGARVLRVSDEHLASLEAVAGDGVLLIVGEASLLPWVNGVAYLGRDPGAPSLLLPTAIAPTVHPALLERAVLARAGGGRGPIAVSVSPPRLISAAGARRIARARVRAFVEGGAW